MNKKRKILTGVIFTVVLLVLVFSFWQKPVLAQQDTTGSTTANVVSVLANSIFIIVGWILYVPTWLVGQLCLVVIHLLVQVAQWNNFIGINTVTMGWQVMRDICNMFFIVILLIIAFGTVLGIENWNYKRLLGRLILAAILINLSKMFCGLMIDAGQVVMATFVNAFKDSAPGVLVNATGLRTVGNLTADTMKNMSNIANGATIMLNLAFIFVSFATILSITLVLIVRVVMLWFLVVFSPIVWIGSLLPITAKYASQWWEQFTKWIIVGPILAFFLWFSLTMFQGADIAKEAGVQEVGEKGAITATLSELSESKNTLNYGFAIAMLVMSLGFATQLGGKFASTAVGWGKKAGMGLAGLSVAATGLGSIGAGLKRQYESRKEKISTTPYARVLTAEGRAARAKELDEKSRIRFGIHGAYERAVSRKTKEYEERGLFRNIAEMKNNFEKAVSSRNYMEAEIYGRQLAKKKELESKHLKGFVTGLAENSKAYQRAANVIDKLIEEVKDKDYNKSINSPVKFENGKYREKDEKEKKADIEAIERKAKATKAGDMGKTLAQMNNADEYIEQAHFYVGLGDDQLRSPTLEQATRDKVFNQLTKIIEKSTDIDLRRGAWDKLNGLSQKSSSGLKSRLPYVYSTPTMPRPGGPAPISGSTPPPPPSGGGAAGTGQTTGGGQANSGGIGGAAGAGGGGRYSMLNVEQFDRERTEKELKKTAVNLKNNYSRKYGITDLDKLSESMEQSENIGERETGKYYKELQKRKEELGM